MNSGIEGNSYGAVISPTRITYKVGQGSTQVLRDAVLIVTNDDEVDYGSTEFATDLILQMPMMYNNGLYVGSGALSLQVPDGTVKCGIARASGAVDLQTYRSNAIQVASGIYSVALGASNNASGFASVALGYNNTASNNYSVAIGAYTNASGYYSTTMGYKGTANNISSKVVIGTAYSSVLNGYYQHGQLGLGAVTTDATATVLKSDANALSVSNQCVLQNNNAMSFTIEVVARNTSTGFAGRWEVKGLIKRGANASTTALVGTPTVTLTNGDAEAWIVAGAIAITGDTTNGALTITATGAASTTIHWMAKILTTEVI
jgi:hypothetical protein